MVSFCGNTQSRWEPRDVELDLRVVQDNSNTPFVKTYSDKGVMIRKKGTDELYSEAIDPQSLHREYEETDILIDQEIDEGLEDEHSA